MLPMLSIVYAGDKIIRIYNFHKITSLIFIYMVNIHFIATLELELLDMQALTPKAVTVCMICSGAITSHFLIWLKLCDYRNI